MDKLAKKIISVEITWQSIFKVLIALFSFYLLFLIKDVLVLVLLGLVISILLNPAIDYVEVKGIRRSLATLLVYCSAASMIVLFFFLTIPPIIMELTAFSKNHSEYFDSLAPYFNNLFFSGFDYSFLDVSFREELIKLTSEIWSIGTRVFNVLFAIVTIFTLAFFFSMEEKEIISFIKLFSPKKLEENIIHSWTKGRLTVAKWFGSRILISAILALMTLIGCYLLDIKFAVSLSLIAGFLNMIPVVGPIISAVIICLVAAMNSWETSLLALLMVTVTQQIESSVFNPLIMNKMVGLPNFLILSSILIGGTLMGIIGMVLAIPIAGIMYETVKNYITMRKAKE